MTSISTIVRAIAWGLSLLLGPANLVRGQQISPALFELGAQQFQTAYYGRNNSLIDPKAEQTFNMLRGQMSYLFIGFNTNPIRHRYKQAICRFHSVSLNWNLQPARPSNEHYSFHPSELLRQDSTALFQIGYKFKRLKRTGDSSYPTEFRLSNWSMVYGLSNHRLVMPASRLASDEELPPDSVFAQDFRCHALTLAYEWAPFFMLRRGGSFSLLNTRIEAESQKRPSAYAFILRPFIKYLYLQPNDSLVLQLDGYLNMKSKQVIEHITIPGFQIDFTYEWMTFFTRLSYPMNVGQISNRIPGLNNRGPDITFGFVYTPGISHSPFKIYRILKEDDRTAAKELNEKINSRIKSILSQQPTYH